MPWQLTSPGSSEYSKALATSGKAAGPWPGENIIGSMHSTVVVFPAPFGPRMPKISPFSTEKVTASTATVDP